MKGFVAELIKGDLNASDAQAITAALAKLGVEKPSDYAYVDEEDIAAVAIEAKLTKVGAKKVAQIVASKAAPKAASFAAASTVSPPPPPDHRVELLPAKVRTEVYEAALLFINEVHPFLFH